jgi:hypothetical protein
MSPSGEAIPSPRQFHGRHHDLVWLRNINVTDHHGYVRYVV